MRRPRPAVITVCSAVALDVLGGIVFAAVNHIPDTSGLYWAVTTVTTVGYGDITPGTPHGRLVAVIVMLTCIPLYSASVALFMTGHIVGHVREAERRIKAHVELHSHRPPDEPPPVTGE